ncbi:hypothetical protein SAMN02799630_01266 [Paenibacillus sp. UNCCL117]|uniref:CBO0543 family protein n=1 Tax=unclassified Paenibacillus TaxID=185978 RepID=UPI00088F4558|nr:MULTISPECIES: CBO0543 family protein [unclassified Paenibacillus]SDC71515.1 hypothetical protein SAMN04488602_103244 [Paenibacillus sp. cl123]SFW24494.1 hypothetical protein SAMN02799630_01266 [Paenibacillus sp. UNCCL117]
MTLDRFVLILLWGLSVVLAVIMIPRRKVRIAAIALLFCQALLWVSSLLHSRHDLIQFPVREFPKATDLLVTTEYFFYPFFCALYVIREPMNQSRINWKSLITCVTAATVIDLLLATYTNLVRYENYAWYWTWLVFLVQFLATRYYCCWFFRSSAFISHQEE